ncbi:MAG: hypothetical protein M1815_004132 [Lichina confinis]|nr:MAG: hypothetical protein M1815_004132 [Lichina confinis]
MDRLKWDLPTTTVIRSQHRLSEEEKAEILKRKEEKESIFTKMDWDRAIATDRTPRLHLKAPVHSAVYIQQIAGLSEAPLVETAMADALGLQPEEMIRCPVHTPVVSVRKLFDPPTGEELEKLHRQVAAQADRCEDN